MSNRQTRLRYKRMKRIVKGVGKLLEDEQTLEVLKNVKEMLQEYGELCTKMDELRRAVDLLEQENLALKRLMGVKNPVLTYKEVLQGEPNGYFDRRDRWVQHLDSTLKGEVLIDKAPKVQFGMEEEDTL